jgi:GTPase SAR1 family protein
MHQFLPEIRTHGPPAAPFILCATKIDLYNDLKLKQSLQEQGQTLVTPDEVIQVTFMSFHFIHFMLATS